MNNFDQAELPEIDAVKMTKTDLKSYLKLI